MDFCFWTSFHLSVLQAAWPVVLCTSCLPFLLNICRCCLGNFTHPLQLIRFLWSFITIFRMVIATMSRNTCQWWFVLTRPFSHVIIHTPWPGLSSKRQQHCCHLLPLFPPLSWSSTCPHPEVTFSMTVKASFVQFPPTLGLFNKHLSGLFPSSFLPLPCPHWKHLDMT